MCAEQCLTKTICQKKKISSKNAEYVVYLLYIPRTLFPIMAPPSIPGCQIPPSPAAIPPFHIPSQVTIPLPPSPRMALNNNSQGPQVVKVLKYIQWQRFHPIFLQISAKKLFTITSYFFTTHGALVIVWEMPSLIIC